MESHIAVVVGEIEARHDDGVACTTKETGSNKKRVVVELPEDSRAKGTKGAVNEDGRELELELRR